MSRYQVRGFDLIPDINSKFDPETAGFLVEGERISRQHESGELAIPVIEAEKLEIERRHDSGLYRLVDHVLRGWQNKVGTVQEYAPLHVEPKVVAHVYVPAVIPVASSNVAEIPVRLNYNSVVSEDAPRKEDTQDEKDARWIEVMGRMPHDYMFGGFKGLDEVPQFKDMDFLAGVDIELEMSRTPFIPRRVDSIVLAIMRQKPADWDLSKGKPEEDLW